MDSEIRLQKSGYHSEFGSWIGRIVSTVSLTVRQRMYREFEKKNGHPHSVLDVGVTSESIAPEANFFEEMFPYKDRITAIGIEDAFHLEQKYPGLKFVKVRSGQSLPFENGQFEVVFSNAVIEHIVNIEDQLQFLRELVRVGKKVFLTTPNKYFPIEHHTAIPFIHFLMPKLFYRLLDLRKKGGFYNYSNLRPMGKSDLIFLFDLLGYPYEIQPVYFGGWISNWIITIKR